MLSHVINSLRLEYNYKDIFMVRSHTARKGITSTDDRVRYTGPALFTCKLL